MLRFAITDRARVEQPWERSLPARCAALARDGVDFLLIREKDLPGAALAELCRTIRSAIGALEPASCTRILVSSRPDIALAVELDGVHLSSHPDELTVFQVGEIFRRAARPAFFISVSCHSSAEVRRAREAGADAALFAPVFGKFSGGQEVSRPAGFEALRSACAEGHPIPVFALGGVTEKDAPACLEAGAAGVAGIRLFHEP